MSAPPFTSGPWRRRLGRPSAPRAPLLLAPGLFLLLGACGGGDSPVVPRENSLTAEEATEVLAVLSLVYVPSPTVGPTGGPARTGAAGEGGAETRHPAVEPASEPAWEVTTTNWTLTCPSGGELRGEQRDSLGISSDFRSDAGGDTTWVGESAWRGFSEIETRYEGCTVSSPITGRTWRFSSVVTPMVYELETNATARSFTLADGTFGYRGSATSDGTFSGTLSWEEGGRSGACAFDLATSYAYDYDASVYEWWVATRGTSCGIPVADTLRGSASLGS